MLTSSFALCVCLDSYLVGLGGRGEEWVSLLGMNESNGHHSVFWTNKGLCFMSGYQKVIQSLLHTCCLICPFQTNGMTHHEKYTLCFPPESYSKLFTQYFLYAHPFHELPTLHFEGKKVHHQVRHTLWTQKCTRIMANQLSRMVGSITQKEWGVCFTIQTMHQAQSAMLDKAGLRQLSQEASKIHGAHYNAMRHSARTGKKEYNREDRAVPCNDNEMEVQWMMCNFIHQFQWKLNESKAKKPCNPVQDFMARIKQWIGLIGSDVQEIKD